MKEGRGKGRGEEGEGRGEGKEGREGREQERRRGRKGGGEDTHASPFYTSKLFIRRFNCIPRTHPLEVLGERCRCIARGGRGTSGILGIIITIFGIIIAIFGIFVVRVFVDVGVEICVIINYVEPFSFLFVVRGYQKRTLPKNNLVR